MNIFHTKVLSWVAFTLSVSFAVAGTVHADFKSEDSCITQFPTGCFPAADGAWKPSCTKYAPFKKRMDLVKAINSHPNKKERELLRKQADSECVVFKSQNTCVAQFPTGCHQLTDHNWEPSCPTAAARKKQKELVRLIRSRPSNQEQRDLFNRANEACVETVSKGRQDFQEDLRSLREAFGIEPKNKHDAAPANKK